MAQSRQLMLLRLGILKPDNLLNQASPSIPDPKYHLTPEHPAKGAASIIADALLYSVDSDTESVYHGRGCSWSV
jgi:hypothetical protein